MRLEDWGDWVENPAYERDVQSTPNGTGEETINDIYDYSNDIDIDDIGNRNTDLQSEGTYEVDFEFRDPRNLNIIYDDVKLMYQIISGIIMINIATSTIDTQITSNGNKLKLNWDGITIENKNTLSRSYYKNNNDMVLNNTISQLGNKLNITLSFFHIIKIQLFK